MRGFPNLTSPEPMKAKFYEGELWKTDLDLMPMIDRYEVILVDEPDGLRPGSHALRHVLPGV